MKTIDRVFWSLAWLKKDWRLGFWNVIKAGLIKRRFYAFAYREFYEGLAFLSTSARIPVVHYPLFHSSITPLAS